MGGFKNLNGRSQFRTVTRLVEASKGGGHIPWAAFVEKHPKASSRKIKLAFVGAGTIWVNAKVSIVGRAKEGKKPWVNEAPGLRPQEGDSSLDFAID